MPWQLTEPALHPLTSNPRRDEHLVRAVSIVTKLGVRPLGQPSAELLGQPDEDALRAADVTEQMAALELLHLADEFGAAGS